jgi:hypothetical protein
MTSASSPQNRGTASNGLAGVSQTPTATPDFGTTIISRTLELASSPIRLRSLYSLIASPPCRVRKSNNDAHRAQRRPSQARKSGSNTHNGPKSTVSRSLEAAQKLHSTFGSCTISSSKPFAIKSFRCSLAVTAQMLPLTTIFTKRDDIHALPPCRNRLDCPYFGRP